MFCWTTQTNPNPEIHFSLSWPLKKWAPSFHPLKVLAKFLLRTSYIVPRFLKWHVLALQNCHNNHIPKGDLSLSKLVCHPFMYRPLANLSLKNLTSAEVGRYWWVTLDSVIHLWRALTVAPFCLACKIYLRTEWKRYFVWSISSHWGGAPFVINPYTSAAVFQLELHFRKCSSWPHMNYRFWELRWLESVDCFGSSLAAAWMTNRFCR